MNKHILCSLLLISLLCLPYSGGRAQAATPAPETQTYLPIIAYQMPPTWLGPEGGKIVTLNIDPSNPNILYAGTFGAGVYKSTDSGGTWQPARNGLGNLYINSFAIDRQNPATLYAGTYKDGVYKSTDAGASWFHSNSGVQTSAVVYTIAVDPVNSSRVYIGTRGEIGVSGPPWMGVMYRSTDGGAHWTVSLKDLGGSDQQDWIYSISILPGSTNFMLAASHQHGPYRSTNYGASWISVNSGVEDGSGRAVVFDPTSLSPSVAYYGVWHLSGVYKTTSSANSWQPANNGLSGIKIYGMAIDPTHPNNVYACTMNETNTSNRGVWKTSDGAESWRSAGLQNINIYSLAVDPRNSSNLYAGTMGSGLFRSLAGGKDWFLSQTHLISVWASSVIAPIGDRNTLVMGTYGNGVYRSADQGATWTDLNSGLPDMNIHALVADPTHPNLIYALTHSAGLYRMDLSSSTNWTKLSTNLSNATSGLPVYPQGHPLAAPQVLSPEQDPAEVQPDLSSLPSSSTPLLALQFAPSNPAAAYLGSSGAGIYKTTDGGTNWSSSGLSGQTIWSVAVDPLNANQVYAATSAAGLIKISSNGGSNWVDSSLPDGVTVYSLSTTPADPTALYAGTSSGIYKRVSGGSWTAAGLQGQSVSVVAAHPTRAGVLYAGTSSRAYHSTDGGLTWSPAPATLNGSAITAINFDPNMPQAVYYSTNGGGSLRDFN